MTWDDGTVVSADLSSDLAVTLEPLDETGKLLMTVSG